MGYRTSKMIEFSGAEIAGGATVLIGFIAALLKYIAGTFAETKNKISTMEKKHAEQNQNVIELTGTVGRLEGERDGFMSGVERVSAEVLQAVRDIKEK